VKETDLLEQLSQGCVLRKKRWSGDTFGEFSDGEIDSAATDTMIERAHEVITRLRAELAAWKAEAEAAKALIDEALVFDRSDERQIEKHAREDAAWYQWQVARANTDRIAKEKA